jgi:hypothetical protein
MSSGMPDASMVGALQGPPMRPSSGVGSSSHRPSRRRDTSPADAAGRHEWTEYTPSQEIYEAWQALPLIVLAGLR